MSCKPAKARPLSRERGEPSKNEKALQRMKEIRCGGCNRLLARVGQYDQIQIKCPRCGTLNHLKAESLLQAPLSASCRQEASCLHNPSSPG